MTARSGTCSVCGGTFSLRKGGLLRVHGYRQYPRGGEECSGSGQRALTGDCSIDCLEGCAYPGEFSECELGALDALASVAGKDT